MKNVSPELLALLATRQFYRADLFLVALKNGIVLRFTSGDRDIKVNDEITWGDGTGITWGDGSKILSNDGTVYLSGGTTGPYFSKDGEGVLAHWKAGVEVDTLDMSVVPGQAQINGVPFMDALRLGAFDLADVQVRRAYMPTFGDTSVGTVLIFSGYVTECTAGKTAASISVESYLGLLNQNMPRNIHQKPCMNTLFDSACGLNREAYAVAGTVGASSTTSIVTATMSQATGYFTYGKITMTSGANAGISRGVKSYTKGSPGNFQLLVPFPNAPAPGDTFNAYPGCDKTFATCFSKFQNLDNFRGFPFIPDNSTAV